MKDIFEEIGNYMQARDFVICFLLTAIFLFLSFVAHVRWSTVEILDNLGEPHLIHILYYGVPFEMIGVFNPFNMDESYYLNQAGEGLVRMRWDGFFLNVVLFFLLAFIVVYLFRRLRS